MKRVEEVIVLVSDKILIAKLNAGHKVPENPIQYQPAH